MTSGGIEMLMTPTALGVVDHLVYHSEATVDDLAAVIEQPTSTIHDTLDALGSYGLVSVTRDDDEQLTTLADHHVAHAYADLVIQYGHVDWPEFLTPPIIRVCWFLDDHRRATDIADRLGIADRRVHDAIQPLKHRAMLDPAAPEYALADDLQPLHAFAAALVAHAHRQRFHDAAPTARLRWSDPVHALSRAVTPDDTDALIEDDDWHLTGIAAYRDHGLQFYLAGEPAFWYGDAPDGAELVAHTLALDTDARHAGYAMLLIAHLDLDADRLRDAARPFGVSDHIDAMLAALDGDYDADRPLPSPTEFDELRNQYVGDE